MRLTVLGASGLVGSAVARHLAGAADVAVSCLARPVLDLARPASFAAIPADTEVLVHAAGLVGESGDELETWRDNAHSAFHLARHLDQLPRLRLLVYLSTGAVYGPRDEPATSATPPRPVSVYAASKLAAEAMLATTSAELCVLRLYFPFGPGQRLPRLVPRLVDDLLAGRPIELATAAGLPVTNPLPVASLARLVEAVVRGPRPRLANLGGSEQLSIREMCDVMAEALGITPRYVVTDRRPGNLLCVPDLSDPAEDVRAALRETALALAGRR